MKLTALQQTLSWIRAILLGGTFVAVTAALSLLGFEAWKYVTWRNEMIAWDFGTIDRLCGGDTDEERLLEIRFIREWEYKALKKTKGGEPVWLHWKLSKRPYCGNWMLVDRSQSDLIRPIEVRFPNGPPRRLGMDCVGSPVWR
jgi:hypothetical protein